MVKVNLIGDGSLIDVGEHRITHPDESAKANEGRASCYRFENRSNMPFCDGSYK